MFQCVQHCHSEMVMFLKYSQLSELFFSHVVKSIFFASDAFEKSLHQWSSSYWNHFLPVITVA